MLGLSGGCSLRHTRSLVSTLLLACTVSVVAQTNTSGLSGTILDPSGALVPGAIVTLTNSATGFNRSVTAASKGEYSFDQIPPGEYLATITSEGFAPQVKRVQLLVATPLKLDFRLTVGNQEVVDVSATSAAVDTVDASLGKPFDSNTIENLPYIANNVLSLLSLQAGVIGSGQGGSSAGVVNGTRSDQTNITLDGTDNNDQNTGTAFTGALRSTRESIEEFRVTTTNANADAGRSSGAQVSLQTRSGTNTIHGTLYEYYRDPGIVGNSWFNKQSQLNTNKPNIPSKILQHTYGASLGLPIIKNKLFFFGAYETYSQASDTLVTETVPSTLNVNANITASAQQKPTPVVVGGQAYGGLITRTVSFLDSRGGTNASTMSASDIAATDPKCTANGLCPLGPGINPAIIAPGGYTPGGTDLFSQYPLANLSTGGDLYNTGSFAFTSPNPIKQVTNIARIDYNLSPKQIIFVRGNLQQDNSIAALTFPGTVPGSQAFSNNKGISAGHIWNIASNLTNNGRYGLIRQGSSTAGTGTQPYVSIGSVNNLTSTTASSAFIETVHNFVDDFTVIKGRHTFQFGVNDRLLLNQRSNANLVSTSTTAYSALLFSNLIGSNATFDPTYYTNAAHYYSPASSFKTQYEQAILGITGAITKSDQYVGYHASGETLTPILGGVVPTRKFHALEQEYYFQDQYKAGRHLTLTAGLRWVHLGTPYETSGQQLAPTINMDQFLANRFAGAASGVPYNQAIYFDTSGTGAGKPNFWSPQKLNFAPRFAFAWASLDNKTSIRGGYALTFDHFGDGLINSYDAATTASSLSLRGTDFPTPWGKVNADTLPRFSSYHAPDEPTINPTSLALPALGTGGNSNTYGIGSISSHQPTPYGETVNLTVEHEVIHGLTVTTSYVGRYGRHLLAKIDPGQPNNLYDAASGQTYFQAIRAMRMLIDSGVKAENSPTTGYFQNIFPHNKQSYKDSGSTYALTGQQAYFAQTITAVGNETATLNTLDYNAPSEPGGVGVGINRYFHPQGADFFLFEGIGTSNYNSGQVSIRHVVNRTFQYDLNYTFAKSMDLGSAPESSGGNYFDDSTNPRGDYGPSDFDIRHLISSNWVIGLPFGHGQHFLSHTNGIVDRVIGGWTLTGIAKYNTALPFSVSSNSGYGTNFDLSTRAVALVPVSQVGLGHHRYIANGTSSYETALAPNSNALSPATVAITQFRNVYPGEAAPRNNFRGDSYFDLDSGLAKAFRTYHEQAFRIEAEVFNVTNSVRFGSPNATFNSSSFGRYTATTTGQRIFQFSGRYQF
jgi:hypothetical protein